MLSDDSTYLDSSIVIGLNSIDPTFIGSSLSSLLNFIDLASTIDFLQISAGKV